MNDKTCLGRDTDIFVFEEMSAGKEYKDLEGRMELYSDRKDDQIFCPKVAW